MKAIRQLLVVKVAGRRVAIPTDCILSVIQLEAVMPVPRAPVAVAGLAALRSRVLTVIDCARVLDPAAPAASAEGSEAVVIDIDEHGYALLVDAVEDVAEAPGDLMEVRADLGPGWSGLALGLADTATGPILVVDAARIVAMSASSAAGCGRRAA